MLKQTVRIVFYLVIALLVGVIITLVTDSIENIAVEKRIRKDIEADIRNADAPFRASALRSNPHEEIDFMKKYVSTVMENKVIVEERGPSGKPRTESKLFLFSMGENDRPLDFYIREDFLKSELDILDITDYISGIATTIVVFTFILVFTEHRKRARTLQQEFELKHAELSTALEKSEALALLGRMSATLAHELKTPLSTISNLVHVLPSRLSDEKFAKRFVTLVREELDRTQQLIDNLLAYGKEIELRNEAWMPLEPLLRPVAERFQIALTVDIPDDVEILGDRFFLDLLFQNVFRNSREAGADHVRVTFSVAQPQSSTGAFAEICCEDNGTGYPEAADLDELTNPFVTSRSRGGGLGLYLIKKIVTAHEGRLSLYRREKGAGLRIILPERRVKAHG